MSKLTIAQNIATIGPLGYFPKAPGTIGSLPGLAFGAVLGKLYSINMLSAVSVILILVNIFLVAWWAIEETENLWATHDDKRIVVDEFVGMSIVVSFGSFIWWQYLVAFALFRFFDIRKPWLVGYFDREVPSSLGTLMDDVVAGLMSFACFGIINSILLFIL